MRKHPAAIAAGKILKAAGFDFTLTGTLTFRIICESYNERPLFVDLELSRHEDKGRFKVCHLSQDHSEYTRAMLLNNQEFQF